MSEPKEPLWITYEQAVAIHSRQLRRFGGAPGLRDEGMLRSALERPIDKWRYEQSDMAEPESPRIQYLQGVLELDFLKHLGLKHCHGRLCNIPPCIMTEEKQAISVSTGLGNVEVAADQGYQKRIKQIIHKLVEDFESLRRVCV